MCSSEQIMCSLSKKLCNSIIYCAMQWPKCVFNLITVKLVYLGMNL